MFKHMETAESIFEGVVEDSYKTKYTRADANRAGHIRKWEDKPPLQILTPRQVIELASAVKGM